MLSSFSCCWICKRRSRKGYHSIKQWDRLPPATMADDAAYKMHCGWRQGCQNGDTFLWWCCCRNRKHKAPCEDRKRSRWEIKRHYTPPISYLSSPTRKRVFQIDARAKICLIQTNASIIRILRGRYCGSTPAATKLDSHDG
jgi:hypothetical protein